MVSNPRHAWACLGAVLPTIAVSLGCVSPRPAANDPASGDSPKSTVVDEPTQPTPEPEAAVESDAQSPIPIESPFLAIAELEHRLRLFPIDGALLVATNGDNDIGVLDNDKLVFPERMKLSAWHEIQALVGRWPDGVEMFSITGTNTAVAQRRRLTPTGWVLPQKEMGHFHFVGTSQVGSGLLAMVAVSWIDAQKHVYQELKPLTLGTGPPRRFTPPSGRCPEPHFAGKYAVYPDSFASSKLGTLISAGVDCKGDLALEIWLPGKTTSTVHYAADLQLPGARGEDVQVVPGVGEDEAFVFADSAILRIEAGKVSVLPSPPPKGRGGAITPDGTMWFIASQRLHRRTADGYVPVSLPGARVPWSIATDWRGRLWATSDGAIFRLREPGEDEVQGIGLAAKKKTIVPKAFEGPRPGGPDCLDNLVVLSAFTKVTPVDYDFPLTRKALKGHLEFADAQFAVTLDGGKRYLTAKLGKFEVAKKLVRVIEKGVVGSKPTVICKDPTVVRPFKLNLKTGELEPS